MALAATVSLTANVLVAQPTVVGRAVAAWPPVALLICVHVVGLVPASRRVLSVARLAAVLIVGGIAAWLSYGHMAELAARSGASVLGANLLPLTVDGMAIAASLCLVELAPEESATNAAGSSARTAPDEPVTKAAKSHNVAVAARPPKARRTGSATAGEQIRVVMADHPQWTQAEVAREVGCSVRTVRRHLTGTDKTDEPDSRQESGSPTGQERAA